MLNPSQWTREQKKSALPKRDGKLKWQTVMDGRKRRPLFSKAETTSPTESTTALMLTIRIDAYKNHYVSTAQVAVAYLKVHMDNLC
jgi:hypothetical protein